MHIDKELNQLVEESFEILYSKFPELQDNLIGQSITASSNNDRIIRILDHGKWINVRMTGVEFVFEEPSQEVIKAWHTILFKTIIETKNKNNRLKQFISQNDYYELQKAASAKEFKPNNCLDDVKKFIAENKIDLSWHRKKNRFDDFGINEDSIPKLINLLNSSNHVGIGDGKHPDRPADEYVVTNWLECSTMPYEKLMKNTEGRIDLYVKFYIGKRERVTRRKNKWLRKKGVDEDYIVDANANYLCIMSLHLNHDPKLIKYQKGYEYLDKTRNNRR